MRPAATAWLAAAFFLSALPAPAGEPADYKVGVAQPDITRELVRRFEKAGLKPERLAITATHTHTAPMLSGANQTLFGVPIPPEHLAHIDAYTKEFIDKLEQVGLAALGERKPSRLSWG